VRFRTSGEASDEEQFARILARFRDDAVLRQPTAAECDWKPSIFNYYFGRPWESRSVILDAWAVLPQIQQMAGLNRLFRN
jgi:hypothetical protein